MKAAEKGVGVGSPYAKGCEGSGKRKGLRYWKMESRTGRRPERRRGDFGRLELTGMERQMPHASKIFISERGEMEVA